MYSCMYIRTYTKANPKHNKYTCMVIIHIPRMSAALCTGEYVMYKAMPYLQRGFKFIIPKLAL